ncbi:conserved hypothetical protein [Trichinella spiralis]|uniref:hypothetical protein n=1 Tax=Trichinella spiralis TaxID=6334 RepID=UPI0001EFCFB6|nr:conserved hypothetical protein [Trichinella spiralis]
MKKIRRRTVGILDFHKGNIDKEMIKPKRRIKSKKENQRMEFRNYDALLFVFNYFLTIWLFLISIITIAIVSTNKIYCTVLDMVVHLKSHIYNVIFKFKIYENPTQPICDISYMMPK